VATASIGTPSAASCEANADARDDELHRAPQPSHGPHRVEVRARLTPTRGWRDPRPRAPEAASRGRSPRRCDGGSSSRRSSPEAPGSVSNRGRP
jgi:hypothetical protein